MHGLLQPLVARIFDPIEIANEIGGLPTAELDLHDLGADKANRCLLQLGIGAVFWLGAKAKGLEEVLLLVHMPSLAPFPKHLCGSV